MREVEGMPGPPSERELTGTFDRLVVESELLARRSGSMALNIICPKLPAMKK